MGVILAMSPEFYREEAERCRRLVGGQSKSAIMRQLLDLAEEYDIIADGIEAARRQEARAKAEQDLFGDSKGGQDAFSQQLACAQAASPLSDLVFGAVGNFLHQRLHSRAGRS
jgi:hypothetical protein